MDWCASYRRLAVVVAVTADRGLRREVFESTGYSLDYVYDWTVLSSEKRSTAAPATTAYVDLLPLPTPTRPHAQPELFQALTPPLYTGHLPLSWSTGLPSLLRTLPAPAVRPTVASLNQSGLELVALACLRF